MKEQIKKAMSGEEVPFSSFYFRKNVKTLEYEVFGDSIANYRILFDGVDEIRETAKILVQIADEIENASKLSDGDMYFSVFATGEITSHIFRGNWVDSLNMTLGNIYKTREEAEQNKEEMKAKFDEARKKYVRM